MSEATAGKQEEDLEDLGLIGHSYDTLFSIRKRIRKINDLVIPFRKGLTHSQIGTGLAVFVIQIITFGMLVVPFIGLFGGANAPWQLTATWILVPPVLAAQNIVKPMPHGKSIPGTVQSLLRFLLDDPIHRRGLPIATPKQPYREKVVHYQREWVAFEEYVEQDPWEAPISDRVTEERFSFCNHSLGDEEIDFQKWWDDKAAENLERERTASNAKQKDSDDEIGARRGAAISVLEPDDFTDTGAGR